jgi:hypothetical protein
MSSTVNPKFEILNSKNNRLKRQDVDLIAKQSLACGSPLPL